MTLSAAQLLPRNSLVWLIVAQAIAIVPLLIYLPLWLAGVWGFAVFWRLQVYRGLWSLPGLLIKLLLVGAVLAGLLVSFKSALALEPMAALLVSACLLKLMEMSSRKDALLLVYLSFFLLAIQFLFSQSMLTALFVVISLPVVLSSLLAIHQTQGQHKPSTAIKSSLTILVHSIPLMVVLFLVIPRIGSLWSVPHPSAGTTGVSGSMEPGDIQSLSRSAEVALRVTFKEGWPLAPHERYWRGAVLSKFDGRRWEQASPLDYGYGDVVHWSGTPTPAWLERTKPKDQERLIYDVMMEPTHQPWLFSVGLPVSYPKAGLTDVGLTRDFRLLAKQPVSHRVQYSVIAQRNYWLEGRGLSTRQKRLETFFPADSNPETQRKARLWYAQSGNEKAYIDRVLQYFTDQFTYSLEVPLLGKHSVDEFLWGTQIGYCEHFSSAFTFMMRAAGIPARVVVGYQGGEYNLEQGYMLVRQYDAHAWTEVWLTGEGWVRIDPTAAVAPNRIRLNMEDFASQELGESLTFGSQLSVMRWFSDIQMQWDALNYQWHRRVLGFDRSGQAKLLNDLFNGVTPLKMVMFVMASGALVLGIISLQLWWQQRGVKSSSKELRSFRLLSRTLARKNLRRHPSESLTDFCQRCCQAYPNSSKEMILVFDLIQREIYGGATSDRAKLKLALKNLRSSLV